MMAQMTKTMIVTRVVRPIIMTIVSGLEPVAYIIQEYRGIAIAKVVTAIPVGNFFRIPIMNNSLPQGSSSLNGPFSEDPPPTDGKSDGRGEGSYGTS
jgi:hypothetical protein